MTVCALSKVDALAGSEIRGCGRRAPGPCHTRANPQTRPFAGDVPWIETPDTPTSCNERGRVQSTPPEFPCWLPAFGSVYRRNGRQTRIRKRHPIATNGSLNGRRRSTKTNVLGKN